MRVGFQPQHHVEDHSGGPPDSSVTAIEPVAGSSPVGARPPELVVEVDRACHPGVCQLLGFDQGLGEGFFVERGIQRRRHGQQDGLLGSSGWCVESECGTGGLLGRRHDLVEPIGSFPLMGNEDGCQRGRHALDGRQLWN